MNCEFTLNQAVNYIQKQAKNSKMLNKMDVYLVNIALIVICDNVRSISFDQKKEILVDIKKINKVNKLEENVSKLRRILETSSTGVQKQPRPEDHHKIEEQKRKEAAILLQSLFRAHITRSRIILPNELLPFLQENLQGMNEEELEAVSKIIARESVKMFRDPKAYKGEGIRLSKLQVKYKDDNQKVHTLPRTLWLNLSKDEKTVRVQFYGKKQVGTGTYKKVKESQTIEITLSHAAEKPKRKEETVLIRSKDRKHGEKSPYPGQETIARWIEDDLIDMKKSIGVVLELFTLEEIENDPQFKLAGIPKVIRTHQGKTRKKLEWEEQRFSSDLHDVNKTNKVKVDPKGSAEVEFRTEDKLRMIEDLVYTLNKFHQKGKVHRDVKPKNVLMLYNTDQRRPEGYLTDHDLITDFGENDTKGEYPNWDKCSEKGIVLPTTDIFGAATCLADSMFGQGVAKELGITRRRFYLHQVPKVIEKYLLGFVWKRTCQLRDNIVVTPEQQNQIIIDYNNIVSIRHVLSEIMKRDPSSENVIKEYIADCVVAQQVKDLLIVMYTADQELYKFMSSTKFGQSMTRALGKESCSLEEKLKCIQIIYRKYPIFRDFGDRVKKIRTHMYDKNG